MSFSNVELLRHIFDEISFVLKVTEGKSKDSVIYDPVISRAIIRSLEIIGEASNNLQPQFKERYPEVEWRKITNTRNRLIHDYLGVDYDIVWDIVSNKLPELSGFIEQIIIENN